MILVTDHFAVCCYLSIREWAISDNQNRIQSCLVRCSKSLLSTTNKVYWPLERWAKTDDSCITNVVTSHGCKKCVRKNVTDRQTPNH